MWSVASSVNIGRVWGHEHVYITGVMHLLSVLVLAVAVYSRTLPGPECVHTTQAVDESDFELGLVLSCLQSDSCCIHNY